ncbi:hypothetical protein OO015_13510 [Thermomicrobium sp. 4228-Ro]|uniref:DUF6789 family protein n=1 Tax=Thermomicrobium sp. 4228-Ro TaxID=2993937 RepID=UPI0022492DAC|nr:DUF6789 family protein [Thermomicrobium sp. 4228-Ro]MCX2728502.1 hypothetical protein [Thermomicrobium sp. 4228-Ro]
MSGSLRHALAGIVGALAFLVAMAVDLALLRRRTNDLRLLAGLLPVGHRYWPLLGTIMHLVNGAALGVLYGRLRHRLPRPGWLAGTVFALGENLVLWPLIVVLDRIHPDVRAGRLERFNQPVPFLQEVWRHLAYGITLGLLVDRWQRTESEPAP